LATLLANIEKGFAGKGLADLGKPVVTQLDPFLSLAG